MSEGCEYKFARDYMHIELPVGSVELLSKEATPTDFGGVLKANSRVKISAACKIDPRVYRVEIEPNKLLMDTAGASIYRIMPGEGITEISFELKPSRQLDLSELRYLCRLYLLEG